MLDRLDGSRSHHDVSGACDNWGGQRGDVGGVVLIVRVSIDNNVCAQAQASAQSGHETARQSLVARMAHNMIDPVLTGHAHGVVGAAVVNY